MLTFDESTHTYRWCGQPVPSVTSILAPITGYEGIPADVLHRAAIIGTAVHAATELFDKGELDTSSLHPAIIGPVRQWQEFCRDYSPEWEAIERRVFNKRYMYAGTLDRIGFIRGRRVLVDIKTTAAFNPAVYCQLAAYNEALPDDEKVRHCMVVQLPKDGSPYKTYEFSPTDGWPTFLALLTVNSFITQHKVKTSWNSTSSPL